MAKLNSANGLVGPGPINSRKTAKASLNQYHRAGAYRFTASVAALPVDLPGPS